jgi:hypothetical protein
MPEGVSPASGYLQMVMKDGSLIVIFDNILVLADDYVDAFSKFQRVIERCYERNVVLKMAKSWIGFEEAKFFGYEISQGKYSLGKDRKQAIMDMQFPTSVKSMQQFLGSALFFRNFVPNYSDLTAKLHQMTHKDFNWDPVTWTVNYHAEFIKLKETICQSCTLYAPDYDLVWVGRSDASLFACDIVVYQIAIVEGKRVHQLIGVASHKFSKQEFK